MVPLLREETVRRAVVAAYSDYRGDQQDVPIPEVVAAAREMIAEPGVALWIDAMAAGGEPGPLLVGPDDLAVLPYTSGTTGRPKGVHALPPHSNGKRGWRGYLESGVE